MATQIESARQGIITTQMVTVAKNEGLTEDFVQQMVAEGKVVIPNNIIRNPLSTGIGKGLRTKVNASIGTSSDIVDRYKYSERGRQRDNETSKVRRDLDWGKQFKLELSINHFIMF